MSWTVVCDSADCNPLVGIVSAIESVGVLSQVLPQISGLDGVVGSDEPTLGIRDESMHPREPAIEVLRRAVHDSLLDVNAVQVHEARAGIGVCHGALGEGLSGKLLREYLGLA